MTASREETEGRSRRGRPHSSRRRRGAGASWPRTTAARSPAASRPASAGWPSTPSSTKTPSTNTPRPASATAKASSNASGPTKRYPSLTQDEQLRSLVKKFGAKNWKKISGYFENRSDVQCLHRWQKVLNPSLVKGSFY